MAALAVLVHEVVGRELGAAGLARVVVQRGARLRLAVAARPAALRRALLPGHVQHAAEAHRPVARRYVKHRVALALRWIRSLDALYVKFARCSR